MSGIPAAEEAIALSAKQAVATAIVRQVKALTPLVDTVPDVWQQYWDAVNEHGAYTDEELEPLGLSVAKLGSCVTILENLKKMMNNEAVATNTYRVTINSVRHLGI